MWFNLTVLHTCKRGPAMIFRQQSEIKTEAKTLSTFVFCRKGGAILILGRLEKAYTVEQVIQLDQHLAKVLDYFWKKAVTIKHLI